MPENFTQIDRVKVGAFLTENNELYANMYYGDTENMLRDTHRQFSGYDTRLTNRSIDGVTLTAYGSLDEENNEFPPFLLPEELTASVNSQMRHPIDYSRARAGLKGSWQPFGACAPDWSVSEAWRTLQIVGGYEYCFLRVTTPCTKPI